MSETKCVLLGFPLKKASGNDSFIEPVIACVRKSFPASTDDEINAFRAAVTELYELRTKCCTNYGKSGDKAELLAQLTQ
jgi:hypothetical protein